MQKMYSEMMVEPLFQRELSPTRPFSASVNVNSVPGSYYWAGISKTTGAECVVATCTQCSVLTLCRFNLWTAWTKCKWLSYKTFLVMMWMSCWYNIVQNVISYNIVSYNNVNALRERAPFLGHIHWASKETYFFFRTSLTKSTAS